MKALRFILSGKTACFRKPDVNVFAYFTYNNIHKPALLGMLGAIIGLGGHNQLSNKNRGLKKASSSYDDGFPEFYGKLKELKIAITPLAPNGYFSKKIQTFNNSVGYASFEQGGNLIVREQWLENPVWQILILDDESEVFQKISEYFLNGKSVFIPYLGKNDHPAKIDDVRIIELLPFIKEQKVSSLFEENKLQIVKSPPRGELSYYFKEVSPIRLNEQHHFYEYANLIFTNHKIENENVEDVLSCEGNNYAFI
ncbi:type I-B CRISPR-associated protein Cas5b [Sulfurospirillum multivorans]|uniref:CRISPR-associated protein, Cas5, TM1800 family n=2 Tax=Sulfurospirillum multivorans TaxID=66821 RepID=A0AA86ALG8_SULMK|nr:type I-B CRISPR-associated protein Cas5b [Sulfurospirillum multivorans]AHJ12409.1 CRISPR-associated protein, Cas5, TM1800 family [Sulfurospirillum multivorans DSM 12446]QEH05907.1 CRISPR-associated protein, Cas5, TM1800 family [Sulfurospirillum multivorans]